MSNCKYFIRVIITRKLKIVLFIEYYHGILIGIVKSLKKEAPRADKSSRVYPHWNCRVLNDKATRASKNLTAAVGHSRNLSKPMDG